MDCMLFDEHKKVSATVLKRVNSRLKKIRFLCGLAEEFGRDVGFFEAWVSVFDAVETC